MKLTDAQWDVIEPLLPKSSSQGRGRPRLDDRRVIDGILWVMKTGARWRDLPERYPSPATCHRRFQTWNRSSTWAHMLKALADDLIDRGDLDLSECAIDATFAPAKKGALPSEKLSAARGPRSWQSQIEAVFLSPSTWQALPRTKRRWLKIRLRPLMQALRRDVFWRIAPTIATLWTGDSSNATAPN